MYKFTGGVDDIHVNLYNNKRNIKHLFYGVYLLLIYTLLHKLFQGKASENL